MAKAALLHLNHIGDHLKTRRKKNFHEFKVMEKKIASMSTAFYLNQQSEFFLKCKIHSRIKFHGAKMTCRIKRAEKILQ